MNSISRESQIVLGFFSGAWPSFAGCDVGEKCFSISSGWVRQVILFIFDKSSVSQQNFLHVGSVNNQRSLLRSYIFIHLLNIYWYPALCQALKMQRWDTQSFWLAGASQVGKLPGYRQCAQTAINTAMMVSLGSNQGPKVDNPPCLGGWGIVDDWDVLVF